MLLEGKEDKMKKYLVNVNGTDYEITLEEVKDGADFPKKAPAAAPAAAAPAAPAGAENVTAPMPGTILSVNVTAGQSVRKGDILVVLEAMKMENEIMANRDGKVVSVSVSKGASVESGTVLCVIE